MDARIGELVAGRYRIQRLLGRGGMSTVYEASDDKIPRRVALKVFRSELTDENDMRRHEGEIGMLAALNHPGLVTLFDAVADDDGNAVLVLELVTGGDLRHAMDAARLSSAEVSVIGVAVADALAYSHHRGIVHRDVKPGNILMPERDGVDTGARAKLADFGIARLIDETRMTAAGSVLGTAHYLSPEQAVGGMVGAPSDVYSLGLVLLEALTGERPFPGTGVESVAARLMGDPVFPSRLDPAWTTLLRGMTAREPDARLTALEAARSLGRLGAIPAMVPATHESLDATLRLPVVAVAHDSVAHVSSAHDTDEATVTVDATDAASPHSSRTAATVAMTAAAPRSTLALDPAPETHHRAARVLVALRRRPVITIGVLTVAAILVVLATVLVPNGAGSTPGAIDGEGPPEYAEVDGTVGEHLQQLQRSVEP